MIYTFKNLGVGMNPITKALDEVTMRIPKQILEKVFIEPSQGWRNVPANNVKELIKQKVIHPRVLVIAI